MPFFIPSIRSTKLVAAPRSYMPEWESLLGRVVSSLLILLAMLATQNIMAQPVKGSIYADFVPMGSGRSVPLPEGNWELVSSLYQGAPKKGWAAFDVYLLKNLELVNSVPYIVIRKSTQPQKWDGTNCTRDPNNPKDFFVDSHGTLATNFVNKCSIVRSWGNLATWISRPEDHYYWKDIKPLFLSGASANNYSILEAEIQLYHYNDVGLEIQLFIRPPIGISADTFRNDYKEGRGSEEHEFLRNWVSIYIELSEQAYFNKSPRKVIALNYPTRAQSSYPQAVTQSLAEDPDYLGENRPNRAAGTVAVLVEANAAPVFQISTTGEALSLGDNRPNRTNGAIAAPSITLELAKPSSGSASMSGSTLPSVVSTVITEAVKVDAERKAIDKDKRELAQQLEKMQQMLAQLQKANADAAKGAQTAQAPLSPYKPAAPQMFANRRALVIGNDLYADVSKLKNASADAEAMAKALAEVGYQVTKHINVNEKAFKSALREFRAQVQGGDEVLFFYAGHGVQLANANYLLPIDIRGGSEEQIKDDAIQLQRFLEDMQERKTKFTLAVIDACRDNPFKGQGRAIGGRGLAPTTAATGQMVMFSAGSGQQALDKLGANDTDKNGLFTRIFVKEMRKPGVSVDRVLRNVRNQVVEQAKSIGHEQTPALYDQSVGEFYFLN